ncbi:MAG: gfo/Idh/MocA family oxidoreductase [Planctomycetia bacterium]|nr:gfo/Idh/MocA family oxidoreductase [Planctomycetia bacterium]
MTTTRRTFLLSSAAVAATALPARAALETINLACIGTGGRCRHLMKSLVMMKNVRIVALGDVWDVSLAEAQKLAPKAETFKDYRKAIEMKGVDAVLIGSPDHWHVPMMVDALKADRHVYVEKPLTHSPDETTAARKVVADKKKLKVQVGMQQRSMPHLIEAKKLVEEKKLGDVFKVRMSWNRNSDRIRRFKLGVDPKSVDWKGFLGNAKDQPFDEYRFRNWRWFWDFGGGIFTDLMVHWIDVAHWVLNKTDVKSAVSIGHHFVSQGVWETPDTVQTLLSYDGGVQMHFEGTFSNARAGAMIEFMGTEGSLYCDRGRYEFTPETRSKSKSSELILGTGPRGRDFYDKPDGEAVHLDNWLTAIREDKATTADVEAGITSAQAAHEANKALRIKS